MPLRDSYLAAARKATEVVGWALEAGIAHLSAFGVSRENIAQRPRHEVCWLHEALLQFCQAAHLVPGARLHVFGDAAALPSYVPGRDVLGALQEAQEERPARLVVHVGVNYSSQAELDALVRAIGANGIGTVSAAPERYLLSAGLPQVDLVVRTGGDQRLSGFLPFQTAYAELWFTPTFWPELRHEEFLTALAWYAEQDRRFGE
jgi:undecaprenyl diphosphate synthase